MMSCDRNMHCATELLAGTRLHGTLTRWQVLDDVTNNVMATKPQDAAMQPEAALKSADAFTKVLELIFVACCGQEVSEKGDSESQ